MTDRIEARLWVDDPATHMLLKDLGMEPLEAGFSGAALHRKARGRSVAVKNFLMNGGIVTGVGNIYASEALFGAGIHPARSAGRISAARWDRLAQSVRTTLQSALESGGSTLRDFVTVDGTPGHFQHRHAVYGREGKPCRACGSAIEARKTGVDARLTYWCPRCQALGDEP